MGNDVSCISSLSTSPTATVCITRNRSRPLITIVSPLDGRACRVKEPLNVGELMLEMPGHFVAEFGREQLDRCMVSCRRISALPADCNLCAHHVYYLLPMDRLNTHLDSHELRNIVIASRLARAHAALNAYIPYTSKITPLPSTLQHEEAAIMSLTRKRQALHLPRPAREAAIHDNRGKNLEGGKLLHTYQAADDVVDIAGDEQAKLVQRRTHDRGVIKHRPWVPKLDTIIELTVYS